MNRFFRKGIVVPVAVVIVCSFLLVQFPLFNYLGYEFSVAVALLMMIVSAVITFASFRPLLPGPLAITFWNYWKTVRKIFRVTMMLLILPLSIATLNVLSVKNCSYGEGLLFYLLIPCVTVVWTIALAGFCATVSRRPVLLFTILVLCTLLYPLYLGYATPQIYSYSFVYGFFPGFSYDEVLRITPPLLIFRGITLLFSFCLFLLAGVVLRRRSKEGSSANPGALRGAIAITVVLLLGFWFFRVQLGLETSARYIQQTLGRQFKTGHFTIYYSEASFTDEEIRRVAAEHEFRFSQVAEALHVTFEHRIDSYIYPDLETKRRFIGAGNTNIAKPWRTEIHLNKDSWDDVLKHELVHVLAGDFGMPVIKAHYNIGLVEGLAMAVDHEFGNKTLEQYAAAMIRFHLVSDPARLVRPFGFATQASTVSYVMMGAFCKFLIDRYGIVHFKELYHGASVNDVYGVSFERLASDWERSLDRVEVEPSWRPHVEFYFRRPSIFAKECARTIADMNERGAHSLQQKDFVAAQELFHNALQTSWNSESFAGLVRSMFGSARYDSVVQMVGAQLQDSLRRGGIVNLFLLYGDAAWNRGDLDQARHVYDEISSLDLSFRYSEAAAVRRAVLDDPVLRAAMPRYFSGSMNDTVAGRLTDSLASASAAPVLGYVRAKIAFRLRKYDMVVHSLSDIPSLHAQHAQEAQQDSTLDAGREQLLGEAFFMQGEYQQARMHFWQSLNFTSNQAALDRVSDILEQCEWYDKNFARYLR